MNGGRDGGMEVVDGRKEEWRIKEMEEGRDRWNKWKDGGDGWKERVMEEMDGKVERKDARWKGWIEGMDRRKKE